MPRLCGLLLCALTLAPVAQLRAQGSPTSITLRQLLDSVALHHPRITGALARERASRGARGAAGAIANPFFALDVENARFPGGAAPTMDREVMTTLMLPLEQLYQRPASVRRADAQVSAALADTRAERQRTSLNAAHAFYQSARSQVGVEASRDLLQWLDSVVAYNRSRVEEGVAAEVDLIRSELERDLAIAGAAMREAQLARDRATLATFAGQAIPPLLTAVPVEQPLALPPVFGNAGNAVGGAGSLPTQFEPTLDARPDVQAARQRVAATAAAVSVERSMVFRELSGTIGTKRSAGTTTLMTGLSLPIPLFNQNRGDIARAAAERDAMEADQALVELGARGEIAGALAAAQILVIRLRTLTGTGDRASSILGRADDARRIALGAYREGATSLSQVINAARAWGDARVAYHDILYAQHESVLALLVAMGHDLTGEDVTRTGTASEAPSARGIR